MTVATPSRTKKAPLLKQRPSYQPHEELDFNLVSESANSLADHIVKNRKAIESILISYESNEVVEDEIERTLDLLRNLHENKLYFQARVGSVATFLPRNQPLYALSCFVLVPSFMASDVHFRVPSSMRGFLPQLLTALELSVRFPNVHVSPQTRQEFLRDRSALRVNPETQETIPVTDVVIFTGTPKHADELRVVFDERTLFIANGAGHNPIVISEDANIEQAVDATLTLQLYNQGQDCAAPNAVLVHASIFTAFRARLLEELRNVKVGAYRDTSCRVGPISDPEDLVRIQEFLIQNSTWLDVATPGTIRSRDAIVEPTLICKPLSQGGNYIEIFAPVIFIQTYQSDSELAQYFESPRYTLNAMYISVYGTSAYIKQLIGRRIHGMVLHRASTVLWNTHLHEKGIERGVQPYGGYGYGASSLSLNGEVTAKPTLPQRDIFEQLVRQNIKPGRLVKLRKSRLSYTLVVPKDVEKIRRLLHNGENETDAPERIEYADTHSIQKDARYARLNQKHVYHLLKKPNAAHVAQLTPREAVLVREAVALVKKRTHLDIEDFKTQLYAIPASPNMSEQENRSAQRAFFEHVYQLLFGTPTGPRLPEFLKDVDIHDIDNLLDV